MRRRIYQMIEKADAQNRASMLYDRFMIGCILLSLLPLCFREETPALFWLDKVTLLIFIADYGLRWATADFKLREGKIRSFLRYPTTFFALIDLLAILSSLTPLDSSLRIVRMMRLPKCMKTLKLLRYSDGFLLMLQVFRKKKEDLLSVCILAIGYILLAALILFQAEPNTFGNYFDAIYWSTVTLMTVGYGDFYPATTLGKCIMMFSSFLGVIVFALPTCIITAGYLDEIEKKKKK